jgi:hypothetical protein
MTPKQTLSEREKELQSLLATPVGRDEIHKLAAWYCTASGQPRPAGTSVITYILVHERGRGLIGN